MVETTQAKLGRTSVKHKPITSTSKRFKDAGVDFTPGGKDVSISRDKWTPEMELLADYAASLHEVAYGDSIMVSWVNDPRNYSACYGSGSILLNKRRLGRAWIMNATSCTNGFRNYLDLIIHECAHRRSDSHFDEKFYKGCTEVGSKVAVFLAENGLPNWLETQN